MMRAFVAAVCVLIGFIHGANAADFQVCIGQLEQNCPVAPTATFGCGTTFDQAAAMVCAVTVDGLKKISPYRIIPQGTKGGNQCGYAWGVIQCLDQYPAPK
jgi:hypothetical protein